LRYADFQEQLEHQAEDSNERLWDFGRELCESVSHFDLLLIFRRKVRVTHEEDTIISKGTRTTTIPPSCPTPSNYGKGFPTNISHLPRSNEMKKLFLMILGGSEIKMRSMACPLPRRRPL